MEGVREVVCAGAGGGTRRGGGRGLEALCRGGEGDFREGELGLEGRGVEGGGCVGLGLLCEGVLLRFGFLRFH